MGCILIRSHLFFSSWNYSYCISREAVFCRFDGFSSDRTRMLPKISWDPPFLGCPICPSPRINSQSVSWWQKLSWCPRWNPPTESTNNIIVIQMDGCYQLLTKTFLPPTWDFPTKAATCSLLQLWHFLLRDAMITSRTRYFCILKWKFVLLVICF